MRTTVEHIRHFQAVVRFQNLNLAAKKINISPSAVSRSVKIIEEDLGYSLFARVGRNIVLNNEGTRFYEKSVSVVESYQLLFTDAQQSNLNGTYKIGASHWLSSKYISPYLDQLSKKNESLKIEVFSLDSQLAVLKVLSGELDVALCFSPKAHPDLNSYQVHHGNLVLCAAKNHPLASRSQNTLLKDINKYSAVIHKANNLIVSCDDHPMFLKFDIKPRFKFYWDSDFTAIELLKTNQYWSMLPDVIIRNEKALVELKHPKGWSAPYTVSLIVHKDKPKQFVESLLKMMV